MQVTRGSCARIQKSTSSQKRHKIWRSALALTQRIIKKIYIRRYVKSTGHPEMGILHSERLEFHWTMQAIRIDAWRIYIFMQHFLSRHSRVVFRTAKPLYIYALAKYLFCLHLLLLLIKPFILLNCTCTFNAMNENRSGVCAYIYCCVHRQNKTDRHHSVCEPKADWNINWYKSTSRARARSGHVYMLRI